MGNLKGLGLAGNFASNSVWKINELIHPFDQPTSTTLDFLMRLVIGKIDKPWNERVCVCVGMHIRLTTHPQFPGYSNQSEGVLWKTSL